jgi:thioredoxin 1
MKKFLYFTAKWCGPCQMLAPVMQEIANEITVEKIDIDENTDAVTTYNVMSVPTIILLKDDNEVTRTVGAKPKSYYINQYNEN